MNEILELIDKARIEVGCTSYQCEVMENLLELVEAKHKSDVLAAFNRGRVSTSSSVTDISAEEYYERTYVN